MGQIHEKVVEFIERHFGFMSDERMAKIAGADASDQYLAKLRDCAAKGTMPLRADLHPAQKHQYEWDSWNGSEGEYTAYKFTLIFPNAMVKVVVSQSNGYEEYSVESTAGEKLRWSAQMRRCGRCRQWSNEVKIGKDDDLCDKCAA